MFQKDVHLFRGLAITFIVALHSLESFDWTGSAATYDVFRALLSGSSALFFFISGYLFQHLSDRFDYRRYLKRKVETVLVPYLIVSIPALTASLTVVRQAGIWPWFYDLPIPAQIGLFLITGKHLEPLWFVPTMFLFYFAAPLLLRVDRTPRWYWLIVPAFVLSMVIGPNGPTGPLHKAAHYLSVYMIGMCVSHYREVVDRTTAKLLWPLVGATVVMFIMMVAGDKLIRELQLPFKLLNAGLIIFLLRRWEFPSARLVGGLASASFAIYFLHGYLLAAFRLGWTKLATGNLASQSGMFPASVIGFILHTLLVLLACMLIINLVQRMFPRHSRYLIGA